MPIGYVVVWIIGSIIFSYIVVKVVSKLGAAHRRALAKEYAYCRVSRLGEDRTSCLVSFYGGVGARVSFPTNAIKHHNLQEFDEFRWYPVRGREVLPEDIEPVKLEIDEEQLKRFIEAGVGYEDEEEWGRSLAIKGDKQLRDFLGAREEERLKIS